MSKRSCVWWLFRVVKPNVQNCNIALKIDDASILNFKIIVFAL